MQVSQNLRFVACFVKGVLVLNGMNSEDFPLLSQLCCHTLENKQPNYRPISGQRYSSITVMSV